VIRPGDRDGSVSHWYYRGDEAFSAGPEMKTGSFRLGLGLTMPWAMPWTTTTGTW